MPDTTHARGVERSLTITPEPVCDQAFAPFGYLTRNGVGAARSIRNGTVTLTKTPARFVHDAIAADFALDFYDADPVPAAFAIEQAECHPHSAQFFLPLDARRYLVVVWPDHPESGAVPKAFLIPGRDIVVYKPGTWHHGIVALDRRTLFLSGMWKTCDPVRDTRFVMPRTRVDVALEAQTL